MPAAQLVPVQVAEETGFVEYELADAVIIPGLPAAEAGGWLRRHSRRIFRNLGILSLPPMGRNLAAVEEIAIRVKSADGQWVTVAIPEAALDESGDLWAYIARRTTSAVV